MEKKTLVGRLELKLAATESAEKTFSGYGAHFNNVDYARDIIAPGAFTKTLAEHKAAGSTPAFLWNHNAREMPIGVWQAMSEDEKGLKVDGLFIDTTTGTDAYKLAKAGAVTGLSIGYCVVESREDIIDGVPVRTIIEAKLLEISLVTFPCNDLARVSDVKVAHSTKSTSERIAAIENELKALIASLADAEDGEPDDEEETTDEEKAVDPDADEPAEDTPEAKYNRAAIEAVTTLILQLQQEPDGR